ncbi:hypothetical protein JT17_07575 [Glaesserella parasuis]|nr:hypothetical protein JT17_07575 [Glaesserella parasuis]
MWGTDYFCIERKKKFGLKNAVGLCVMGLTAFFVGGSYAKSKMGKNGQKWLKMGSFCNIFCIDPIPNSV